MAIQFCRKAKQTPQGVLTTLHYALSVAYMVKETVRYNALRRCNEQMRGNQITTIWATPKSRNDTKFCQFA